MAATLARPQPSYHDSPRHEQRSTSSPAPGATPRNGYANSFQAESPYNGTPRSITPASPAPNGTTITLPALLAMHDQDPHSALSSLVEAYNALASSASPSSVLQSERDKFATENTKLWSWCSNLKRERDALSKEQKETRNRLVELETLLRGAGLPVPPSRSMSTSPVDELNVPTRPVGPRSYSDGPGSSSRERTPSHETGRRRAGTNASVSAPSTQTGIDVAASPAPSLSLPLQTVSEIATTLTTASPPPISPSASSTGPPPSRHLTRKASSLDLGRKGTLGVNDPAKTPLATRSLTPPPISTSPSMHQDAIIPSGQSAPGTPPPDRARFGGLPVMPPMSPLFPLSNRSSTNAAAVASSHADHASSAPNAQPVPAAIRPRASSDAPLPTSASAATIVSTSSKGKQREAPVESATEHEARSESPSMSMAPPPSRQIEPRSSSQQLRSHSASNPPHYRQHSGPPAAPRPPTLSPTLLPFTTVKVMTSSIKNDHRGREVVAFTVAITLQVPPESDPRKIGGTWRWQVEKSFNDILLLDAAVRSKNGRSQARKIAAVPEKGLFKDNAPSKVDLRKVVTQTYLQSLASVPLQEKADICQFLSTSVISDRNAPVANPAYKAGHLTKKGRSFGGWQTRYYVLNGPLLDYYENQGGQHLGSIDVTGAQIGRQQPAKDAGSSSDSYRHAFLIREARRDGQKIAKQEDHDHILCAESDADRDDWVRVLATWFTGEYLDPGEALTRPARSNETERPSTDSGAPKSTRIGASRKASKDDAARFYNAGAEARTSGDIVAGPPYGVHSRQQSFGQASNASNDEMGSNASSRAFANGIHPSRRGQLADIPSSSSLPSSLDMMANHHPHRSGHAASASAVVDQRSASEQGHYADLQDRKAMLAPQHSFAPHARLTSHGSTHNNNNAEEVIATTRAAHGSSGPRPSSPDRPKREEQTSRTAKISGPKNAVPIGDGVTFKEPRPPALAPSRRDDDRRARVKSSFWTFAVRSGPDRGPAPVARPVFGIPLADAVAIARIRDDFELPAVVYRCIEYLEAKNAQTEEGIYRLSGSSNVIRQLKEQFNNEGDVNLLASSDYLDPHAIAGLLKTFLRELPVHVLTRELQHQFMQVVDLPDRAAKVNQLGSLIGQLPTANYTLLRFLTAHLIHVVQNERINKMNLRNVGIVFSPTLAIPASLFSLLLTEFDIVFAMDGDQPAPGRLDEPVEAMQRTPDSLSFDEKAARRRSRNSILYEASGADKLLEVVGSRLDGPAEDEAEELDEQEADAFADAGDDTSTSPASEQHHALPLDALMRSGTPSTTYSDPEKLRGSPHRFQERSKDLGLSIHTPQTNGLAAPKSPRSPSSNGHSSPHSLKVPLSPGLPLSPRPTRS